MIGLLLQALEVVVALDFKRFAHRNFGVNFAEEGLLFAQVELGVLVALVYFEKF